MSKILLDSNPIVRIGWISSSEFKSDYEYIEVGTDGVSKIDSVEQYLGEYSIVWLQVWKGNSLFARYNARNVDAIYYVN